LNYIHGFHVVSVLIFGTIKTRKLNFTSFWTLTTGHVNNRFQSTKAAFPFFLCSFILQKIKLYMHASRAKRHNPGPSCFKISILIVTLLHSPIFLLLKLSYQTLHVRILYYVILIQLILIKLGFLLNQLSIRCCIKYSGKKQTSNYYNKMAYIK